MHVKALARLFRQFSATGRAPSDPQPVDAGPTVFTEDQARLLLVLQELGIDRDDATWLMWASERFSERRVARGLALLRLDGLEFRSALSEAMRPGALRSLLLRGGPFDDAEMDRLRRELPLEVERVHSQELRWELEGTV